MKKIRNIILSAAVTAMVSAVSGYSTEVSAATKEDVISAARDAGFSEVYVQQGINFLETHPEYNSEQYDMMIAEFEKYKNNTDNLIDQYLQGSSGSGDEEPEDEGPSEPAAGFEFELTPQTPSAPAAGDTGSGAEAGGASNTGGSTENKQPAADSRPSDNSSSSAVQSDASQQQTQNTPQKNYEAMSETEKKEYRESLTQAQKNQILKDLPKDKQLEIINGLIDASSAFGMNVTVDELTKDSINYSIRDDDGKIVDITSMGVIVDDTGIDYTWLILGAAAVVLLSSSGLIWLSFRQKKDDTV